MKTYSFQSQGIAILLTFFTTFCALSSAEACLEIPKPITLQNSPFPFNDFSITSQSFEYVTPDGMINTLRCEERAGAYSWAVATALNGVVTEYGYADIRSAGPSFVADGNETANPTPITLSDNSSSATAVFAKKNGQAALQLNCSVAGNIMTMHVAVKDGSGRIIANIRASKMVGTRSIGRDRAPAGPTVVDFSSTQQQTVDFAGCGVDVPTPVGVPQAPPRPSTIPTDI